MVEAFIGLGSNQQQPALQLAQAVDALASMTETSMVAVSPVYQSRAIGPPQPDYLNAVAQIATTLSPVALLDALQAQEQEQGRVRLEHWGPRTLDLDILLYGQQCLQSPRLVIPHRHLHERPFVLLPLYDLDKALTLPDGRSLAELVTHCDHHDIALTDIALHHPQAEKRHG